MKRAHLWSLALLLALSAAVAGCARPASGISQPRSAEPSMAAPAGSGLGHDSKSYIANDPP